METRLAQAAYEEYRRIHREAGVNLPEWEEIGLTKRMAWEAASARFKGHDGQTLSNEQIINPPAVPDGRRREFRS